MNSNSVADYDFYQAVQRVMILGGLSIGSAALLRTVVSGVSYCTVLIQGGAFSIDPAKIAADKRIVDFGFGGPFTMRDMTFDPAGAGTIVPAEFHFAASGWGQTVEVANCFFLSTLANPITGGNNINQHDNLVWRNYSDPIVLLPPSPVVYNTQFADVSVSGLTRQVTAGENLVFGDPVYFKSDGKAWKADANGSGTFPCVGLATGTVSANASGTILMSGSARNDAWSWTVGGIVYLSTSAGLTQTAPSGTGDVVQVLGVAFPNADTIAWQPSLDMIVHA
jgi:hypothetical protein